MTSQEEVVRLLGAVRFDIVHYTRGTGIDIGRGPSKPYRHFIAMRERGDKLVPPNVAAELWVDSFEAGLSDVKDDSLDFVFVHAGVDVTDGMRVQMARAIKAGGHWVEATWDGDRPELFVFRLDVLGDEREFRLFQEPTLKQKTACVVRFGGIGDALQAASILPELKRQGYHVTWMSEPLGEQVMRHDPNIDRFLVQDKDQVFNPELPQYFDHWSKKFDKWINLCESIEGTLITLPGRAKYNYPWAVRHELCDHNYLEFLAKLAEQPFAPEHHFYPSDAERDRAGEFLGELASKTNPDWQIGKKWIKPFVIMWTLSGSSPHKFYPHQDAVIAKILLEIPHAHVVLVGDDMCRFLQAGWEKEPRVHCLAGELKLRDAITLGQRCDMVIGPETGMLNAVAFESMPKVIFLSHSSVKNLTRDWVNTESMFSRGTKCFPCHQLHEDHSHCPEDVATGAALCQVDIPAAAVWEAVQRGYTASGTVKKILEPA